MPKTVRRRVGIVIQLTRYYCRHVVRAIANFGLHANWEWLLVPCEGARALTVPSDAKVDGVIGHMADAIPAAEFAGAGVPVVDISAAISGSDSAYIRVTNDDIAVGRVAAEHLLSIGITHYGYFGCRHRDDSQSREQGFAASIAAAGYVCTMFQWPAHEPSDAENPNRELGRWVAALPKPAGVLACNDHFALQLMAVCGKLGIGVPNAVAVLGVENDGIFCDLATPSLSSVALATQRIGYEAARTLDHLMQGRQPAERTLLIPPTGVVSRGSSGLRVIGDPDVAAAVRYITQHARDHLQVEDVLREVQVSRRSLDQRFMTLLSRTVSQEIGRARVELARQVLAGTDKSMDQVATMSGFSNAKQFGAIFRSATGSTPSAYRRSGRH